MVGNRYFSKERVMEEIEKCVSLCSNCHRKLEYGYWGCLELNEIILNES